MVERDHAAPPPAVCSQAAPQALASSRILQDVALALGDGDDAAGIEQIEVVGGLDDLLIGGDGQAVAAVAGALFEQRLALGLGIGEVAEQHVGVGGLEIVFTEFLLVLQEDVAIGDLVVARRR